MEKIEKLLKSSRVKVRYLENDLKKIQNEIQIQKLRGGMKNGKS